MQTETEADCPGSCAIVGAVLGVSLEYVISEFGPEIVDGLITGYLLAAPWVSDAALVTAAAFVDFGNDVARAATDSVGAIVVAFDDAAMAVESGFLEAMDVLAAAGIDALAIAQLVGLGVALLPVVPVPISDIVAAITLALLVWSFAVDIAWLKRQATA